MEQYLYTFGPLILIFVLMYFFLIRPQKKKDNDIAKMRSGLQVGDEVVTIGGIVGKITKIKGDTIVIQVGADKLRLEMTKWAISTVTKKTETPQFVPESQREEVAEETPSVTVKRKRFTKKEDGDDDLLKDDDEKISE